MNKSQLLESIQNGYHLFRALLSELDAEQMYQPGAVGKWSVKDTLAHIVVHEQRMIEWIAERLCGGTPAAFQPYDMPETELDGLNEQIYQENLDRSLEDVLSDLARTHAKTLKLVETSREEDLLDPARFRLLRGEPLWEAIAANTFQHYEEHGQDIRRWQAVGLSQNKKF